MSEVREAEPTPCAVSASPVGSESPQGMVAIVVIGRNEGQRLVRCLESVSGEGNPVVYVDSGSTDGSQTTAESWAHQVIALDMSTPFTAARARNVGWLAALDLCDRVEWIQFVDGACEVYAGWIKAAAQFMRTQPKCAAVYGQQFERHPDRSIYNQLCAIEWRVAPGVVKSFAGCVMVRAEALRGTGGYREDLIAGEEPELSVRLRQQGWQIYALDLPMTVHDAAMTRFGQWWQRARRAGYAFANGAQLHGALPERHCVRESLSIWWWAAVVPIAIASCAALWGPVALLLMAVFPAQALRLWWRSRGAPRERVLQAVFLPLSKFPGLVGQLQFLRDHFLGRRMPLIEYK